MVIDKFIFENWDTDTTDYFMIITDLIKSSLSVYYFFSNPIKKILDIM